MSYAEKSSGIVKMMQISQWPERQKPNERRVR